MAQVPPETLDTPAPRERPAWLRLAGSLRHDRLAAGGLIYLAVLGPVLLVGSFLLQELATSPDLTHRNLPPLALSEGWEFLMGSDTLGRSVLARIVMGGSRTIGVALATVSIAMVIGTAIGIFAGYRGGLADNVIMRTADVSLAFPGILLAVVLLYIFPPSLATVIIVLVVNRLPLYIRVTRAETLEVRERLFVAAARVLGASSWRIAARHILPVVAPTILTVATLDLAVVMLVESSLSFLGLGVQPPDISWGLMVADGRNYLRSAWWLAFFPGLAIVLTAVAINLVANWLRVTLDPVQAARLHREDSPEPAKDEVDHDRP